MPEYDDNRQPILHEDPKPSGEAEPFKATDLQVPTEPVKGSGEGEPVKSTGYYENPPKKRAAK